LKRLGDHSFSREACCSASLKTYGFADLHRHVLALGVFLDIRGEREAFDDVGSVILFLRPVAEEASQLLNSALTRFSSVLSPEKPVQADICLPTSADRST